jgi:plastocyanin
MRELGLGAGPQAVTATAATIPEAPQVTFTAGAGDAIVDVGTTDVGDCHLGFTPRDITVQVGSTVAWGWIVCDADGDGNGAAHDVTFEDDRTPPVSSPEKNSGFHLRTFTVAHVYRYRCTLHSTSYTEGEVGTVTVR